MFQGTGSDVGKSLLVAGLARAFVRRGLAVRPFKPQNMSNNAAVVAGGGAEIGRAQALQAVACGVPATVHMNPVLLKPQTDVGAQVIVQGKVTGNAEARDYHALKPKLLAKVMESFGILRAEADLVLVEGAGSAAEVNLRQGDIANMGFALEAHVPVVLIGDIDRGGVIASLVGTHVLLEKAERDLLAGYIVNKFRGDPTLFDNALPIVEKHTGLKCFGVVPWFDGARLLPKEDAASLDNAPADATADAPIKVAVPRLAHIANFDDLDPLRVEPDVEVRMIEAGEALPGDADLVLIPGSKTTLSDLAHLRKQGWDIDIFAHVHRGGMVVGLCGGFQMLGRRIADPDGIEGPAGEAPGLGLLDIETTMAGEKVLGVASGVEVASGEAVQGYEMHMGETTGGDLARPWLALADGRFDGAVSAERRIMGSYVHGIFAADGFRRAFLARIRAGRASDVAYEARIEAVLDGLAEHLERHLDLDALLAAAR